MRQFVIVGHDVPTTPDFALDNLPGAGRLDVLCRAVTASVLLSHGIREDVRTWVVLADEYTVRFEGSELRRLNPDERSTGALFKTALEERQEAVGHVPVETTPGVYLSRRDLDATLDRAAEDGTIIQLHGGGEAIAETEPPESPVFVLSDHHDFPDSEESLLDEYAEVTVSLGPRRLHGNQAITIAHNFLDTAGYSDY